MSYIKGLLFDKDGTLFDFHNTWSVWCHSYITEMANQDAGLADKLANALQFDMQAVAFHPESPVIAGTMEEMVTATRDVIPHTTEAELRQSIIDAASTVVLSPATPLIPLMEVLQARYLKLGVATNDSEFLAHKHLSDQRIEGYFDFIAGYDSGHGAKPEPGMLLAFCAATDLPADQVAMIGDSTHDLHAARAAGMVAVGVLTGPATKADLAPHADIVLPDIGHLPDWLTAQS
ncbi:HAD family hydrolase [Halovulum sp. GXIMD14793]